VADAEAAGERKLVCYDCGVNCDLDGMKQQRLFFLRRMNAWSPRAPLPSRRRNSKPEGDKSQRPTPRPNTDSGQAEPSRYRLGYSKLGAAAFLSHLDLVRHLPRAFRRAGLEIFYSRGFHPKPGLSFGPALGLGIPSLGELLDVKLVDRLPAEEILERLRVVSPPGIDFLSATALGEGALALGRVLGQAHYAVRLPDGLSAEAAQTVWDAGAPLVARRRERSDSRRADDAHTVDVRKSMVFARAASPEDCIQLNDKLGWSAEDGLLTFGLVVSALGSARPVEVVEALFGEAGLTGCEIVRTGFQTVSSAARDGSSP